MIIEMNAVKSRTGNGVLRRGVLALVVLLLACTLLAGAVSADGTDAIYYSGGDGTEANPYRIGTVENLKNLSQKVAAGTNYQNTYFKVTADLNLNNDPWTPIGLDENKAFKGKFNGDFHTISNLKNTSKSNNLGLFGYITYANLTNITIQNVNLTAGQCVGALLGYAHSTTNIENCRVIGTIQITGNYKAGGLAGGGYANIRNCTVTGDGQSFVKGVHITSPNDHEGDNVGGLIGFVGEGTIQIENCHASIPVSGSRKVGGLIGFLSGAGGSSSNDRVAVLDSSASGSVTLTYVEGYDDKYTIGSFIGEIQNDPNEAGGPMRSVQTSQATGAIIIEEGEYAGTIYAGFIGGTRGAGGGRNHADDLSILEGKVTDCTFILDAENIASLRALGDNVNLDTWEVSDDLTPTPRPDPVPPAPPAPVISSGDGNMNNAYRVLFETNGGSFIRPATDLSAGDKITAPANPVKDGYTFAGWYKDAACTQGWSFSDAIDGDMTLYAKWTADTPQTTETAEPTAKATAEQTAAPTKAPATTAPTAVATTAAPAATTAAGVSPTLTQAPAPVLGALLGLLAAGVLLRRRD